MDIISNEENVIQVSDGSIYSIMKTIDKQFTVKGGYMCDDGDNVSIILAPNQNGVDTAFTMKQIQDYAGHGDFLTTLMCTVTAIIQPRRQKWTI